MHMDTEEAHVNVEVRTGEDTETNRDIDGEDSVIKLVFFFGLHRTLLVCFYIT